MNLLTKFHGYMYGVQVQVDRSRAILAVTRYLEQLLDNVVPMDAVLQDNIWSVTVSVGLINKKKMVVKVDSKTGKILSYIFDLTT